MRYFFAIFFLVAFQAKGFIPPVPSILKDIFDGRKFGEGVELVFVHQVANSNGGWSEVEERVLSDSRGLKFLWKPSGLATWLSGSLDKRTYLLGTEKKVGSRSLLFLKNFTAGSSLEFRDALINERFLRWEQLKQFKEGFEPQGEPQTWDIKSNYLFHDSISLVLLPSGPTVAVVGYQDPNSKRAVYFDSSGGGIRRLEWVEPTENVIWNFEPAAINMKEALFSKRAKLSRDGRDLVQTELVAIRPLSKRQALEWIQSWQRATKTLVNAPAAEEALRTLLSSR